MRQERWPRQQGPLLPALIAISIGVVVGTIAAGAIARADEVLIMGTFMSLMIIAVLRSADGRRLRPEC